MHRHHLLALIVGPALTASASIGAQTTDAIYGLQPTDPAAIEACINREGRDAATCVGALSKRCTEAAERAEVQDTQGIIDLQCWGREAAAWDVLLNRAYAGQMDLAREIDATPSASTDPPDAAGTLRDAQRAWIVFRDAERARIWALRVNAGADWRAADLEAMGARLTALRALDLLND